MSAQPAGPGPSQPVQAWDNVRRVREPVAWMLLALTAFIVLVSACQLFNLAGATIPVAARSVPAIARSSPVPVPAGSSPVPAPAPAGTAPVPVSAYSLRASAVAPQFLGALVVALPVLSVVLAVFSGGLTSRARRVVQLAVGVQAVTLALGLISVVGAAGSQTRPGTWFILAAAELALAATALVFTAVVLRSAGLGVGVRRDA